MGSPQADGCSTFCFLDTLSTMQRHTVHVFEKSVIWDSALA